MEDFTVDKFITGLVTCPECGFSWQVTVPYGEFFIAECQHCGGLVGEIQEPNLVIV